MTPTSATVSRRDAAIAAALAGTVVVVLGYASGLGVQVESTATLTPVQPARAGGPGRAAARAGAHAGGRGRPGDRAHPGHEQLPGAYSPRGPRPHRAAAHRTLHGARGAGRPRATTCTSVLESLPVVGPATVAAHVSLGRRPRHHPAHRRAGRPAARHRRTRPSWAACWGPDNEGASVRDAAAGRAAAVGTVAAPAHAHTELEDSDPADGATLEKLPEYAELVFSEVVEPAELIVEADGTKLSVLPTAGQPEAVTVDLGTVKATGDGDADLGARRRGRARERQARSPSRCAPPRARTPLAPPPPNRQGRQRRRPCSDPPR